MIGLVLVRHDQDWGGFAVVIGILLVLAALAYLDAWRADRRTARRNPAPEVDHTECVNPDCDFVLCYCHGQAAPCPGTEEPGCSHHTLVCHEHRLVECVDCRIDVRDDAGLRW